MADELLFHVTGSTAARAERIPLAEAGLREREHLQEWLLANPDVVAADMLVVTSEFDRWLPSGSSSSGRSVRDRLDILGLDTSGRLVVAELKRDRAADTVEMQAIKYAAMVAQFDVQRLAKAHAAHLQARGAQVTVDGARQRLEDHADGPLDLKVLHRPRIVLIAGDFLDTTTTSAVWLTQMGVDVDLVKYQAYRTPGGIVVTTSKVWPLEEAENLVVRPEEREEAEETQRERRRSRSVVARLVEARLIDDGTPLRVNPDNGQLSRQLRDEVRAWLDEDPGRATATWVNANPRCLMWGVDGSAHSASGLASRIVEQATGQRVHVTGPLWWVDSDGNRLADVLEAHTGEPVYADTLVERDWGDLHDLLGKLPSGRWTSYGDLAGAIGSSAIAVGQHVAVCSECPNAYRVLDKDGRVSEGFSWADDRDDDPAELLELEGLRFDSNQRAAPEQRMRWG